MLVSVISLDRGVGVTSTAMLLAMGIGAMKKKSLLVHTSRKTNIYMDYFGLKELEDKTTAPNLLVKLLREGAITSDAMADYCRQVAPNSFLFTNSSDSVSNDDMFELAQYFVQGSDFDYVLYDMDDWGNPTAKYVLEKADVVVICIPQSYAHLKAFRQKLKTFRKMFLNKSVILVCDRFDPTVGSYKELSKALGFKADCYVIHHNSWVGWSQNRGRFGEFFSMCANRSPNMIEVGNDITKLVNGVFRIKSKMAQAAQEVRKTQMLKSKSVSDSETGKDSVTPGSAKSETAQDGAQASSGGPTSSGLFPAGSSVPGAVTGDSGAKQGGFDRTWYRG